jgi:galactose mutarotase-like enzyme
MTTSLRSMAETELVLGAAPGPVLHLLTLGATVHRLEIACGDGVRRNVVLGHPSAEDYLASGDYLGGTIGRYANRIAGGAFRLDGVDVRVATHDRGNSLHGGPDGFDRRPWTVVEQSDHHAVLEIVSPDGDQGFPGTVTARAGFEVVGHRVVVAFEATTDAATVVALTSHAYFNLDGEGAGTVDEHLLTVPADHYVPIDPSGIPAGALADVAGTPFDLRSPTPIGPVLRRGHEQIRLARGLDHHFDVRGEGLRTAAVLESARTRTRLELRTDQPGLQVYTGNALDGTGRSTGGGLHRQGDGIALEPQPAPDSPNRSDVPSVVLRPGETYRASLSWELSSLPVPPRGP